MKILLVSEDLPGEQLGGLAKHVLALAHALQAQGHEVTLMGRQLELTAAATRELDFNGRLLQAFPNPSRGWKEQRLGVFNPLKRPYFAWRIALAINRYAHQFDVIHYHGHLPMVGAFLPSDIHFIQTRHDQGGDCITNVRFKNNQQCKESSPQACASCATARPSFIQRSISAAAVRLYRKLTLVAYQRHPTIFVSDFLRASFGRRYPSSGLATLHVVHNFIEESRLPGNRASAGQSTHSNCYVIAARVDLAKGVPQFLAAASRRLHSKFSVSVYGDGPLLDQARAIRTQFAVKFHGHSAKSTVLDAIATARAVIVPSLCEESCSTVILEALRMGKTCFALRSGGNPELGVYGHKDQLRLFSSFDPLIEELNAYEPRAQAAAWHLSADVEARLAEIIPLYEKVTNG
jgi:glycosyltransferase involved in cell wall biosynthesis